MPTSFESIANRHDTVLWIVSSGGHLAEALHIEQHTGPNPQSHWITNDVPQTRSLLSLRRATFLPYVAPRDLRGSAHAARVALKVAKDLRPDVVISTGAAIAGIALPVLAARGYNTVFIESLARMTAHSLTGRICQIAPRVRTFTQYRSGASPQWSFDGTILSSWHSEHRHQSRNRPMRILVTLGTIRPYRFDRAVKSVLQILAPSDEVVWQLGASMQSGLPGQVFDYLPNSELRRFIRESDIVISHAGVGSIIDVLEEGKAPLLLVRESAFGEHIDDHQKDIADEMTRRRLGVIFDMRRPLRNLMEEASQMHVTLNDRE